MKVRFTAIVAIVSFCLSLALSADEVTKKTLPDICPKLEIKTSKVNANCHSIEVNIPASEVRFQHLLQAWFIILDEDGDLVLRVPIHITNIDGVKRIAVDASPEMIKNAKIHLDCKRKDPTLSSLDVVILVLPSLLDLND